MKKIFTKILIIIIFILIFSIFYWNIQKPSKKVMSISDEIFLVIGDSLFTEDYPVILDNEIIYISLSIIKEYLDPNIFYDSKEDKIIFTNGEKVSRFIIDEKKASINHREFYINNPIKKLNDKIYIPDEILNIHYDINLDYFQHTNAIVLDGINLNYVQGEIILEGADIRVGFNRKSPIVLKDLPLETVVSVFEELEGWYKVRTYDGIIGYLEKKYLKINLTQDVYKVEGEFRGKEYRKNEKINLTWDYTYGKMRSIDNVEPIEGINILSPTWFSISNDRGDIYDKGNLDYVQKYKALGYEIWPLIDNGFDPDLTQRLLASSKSREDLIYRMIQIYNRYGVDGINLDFENIYLKDRDLLTQFVRELYPVFKERGMTVSMDITPISTSENWSLSFNREDLSKTVDYLVLMAYDQHWATSPVAGSVAQYTWVEKSIKEVLKETPNHKLLLGVPFYTRLWTIEDIDGKEEVSSQALSMEAANNFIDENSIELEWDEVSGQYFGEITKDKKIYKIWVEDAKSLEFKSSLVNKYDLAGIASWRKGFETEEVWPAISNSIKLN